MKFRYKLLFTAFALLSITWAGAGVSAQVVRVYPSAPTAQSGPGQSTGQQQLAANRQQSTGQQRMVSVEQQSAGAGRAATGLTATEDATAATTAATAAPTVATVTESATTTTAATGEPQAPTWGVKTNLLYDATTTLNLGFEFKVGPKTTIDIPVSYNPWQFRGGLTKLKHILVQPEVRRWLDEAFTGHFFGLHGHYAFYNVGGLPSGPFSQYMRDHRFQGWLAGAGVSWGYRWNLRNRWALEATVGVGYAYLDYGKYPCVRCGALIAEETKNYFGPTKAGVNLIFGGGAPKTILVPVPVPAPAPAPAPIPEPEPAPAPAPVPVYMPSLRANVITPAAEPVKARSESGQAYLEFAVGRAEIMPGFRGNGVELEKIHASIRTVNGDPDVTIRSMALIGHASPEGSYSSNMNLSQRRAEALRHYLNGIYGFFGSNMTSRGEGEDWETLAELVEESYLTDKYALMGVIRGGGDPDLRERQLMAVGRGIPYRTIRGELYPRLRRTDYIIEYEVAPIGIERGKQILRTRPGNLSLNEMFLIANTYAPGSAEFNEVFDIAARVFPDNDVANLNAAANALNRGDAASAAGYLARVKNRDSAWHNNMGILSFMRGDAAAAANHFRQGGGAAATNLSEVERHLQTVK
ncbi:MAG: DUF3575 domain-containing protein [Alistipes sp.]|jgi:outer membrane protein OmpA-like peptidoglycan-associated protein|nr:DUF3575 domain-containing protein [Alistipes sp.]